ncbi:hypothetical protein NCCP2165_01310 [Halomonas sp. NCCP-2165]|nr:hypothetical protein NCCP2165_01310 [Halomonas sp. NCCP-2165]
MDATPLSLFWKGFTVAHHEFLDPQTLRLQLEPDDRTPPVCSGCDHVCFLDTISPNRPQTSHQAVCGRLGEMVSRLKGEAYEGDSAVSEGNAGICPRPAATDGSRGLNDAVPHYKNDWGTEWGTGHGKKKKKPLKSAA